MNDYPGIVSRTAIAPEVGIYKSGSGAKTGGTPPKCDRYKYFVRIGKKLICEGTSSDCANIVGCTSGTISQAARFKRLVKGKFIITRVSKSDIGN